MYVCMYVCIYIYIYALFIKLLVSKRNNYIYYSKQLLQIIRINKLFEEMYLQSRGQIVATMCPAAT